MELPFEIARSYWVLLKRKFYDPLGAILLVILVVVATTIFLPFVKIQKTPVIDLLDWRWQIGLYLFLMGISLLFWICKRKVPKFRTVQTGILFAPSHDEAIEKELYDLEQRLREEVKKTDFQDMICIKRLPPNHKVGQHIDNSRILQRSGARILICGRFEKFTIKGKELTGFSSLTVSCAMLPVHPRYAPNLLLDSISGKQWAWEVENTINRNIVASNLSEVSRYIIGLSLIAQRQYDKAQRVLGPLTAEVNNKYGQLRCSPETKRFKQRVADAYASAISFDIQDCYLRELEDEKIFQLPPHQITEWKSRIENAIKISPYNPNLFMQLAIYEFLSGHVAQAKDAIRKSRQLIPIGQQYTYDLSEAFLLAFEGHLREAKHLYKKVSESGSLPNANNMYQIITFLHQACEKYQDNLEIRFLYGIFNYEFGDKNLAYKELEKFCSLAESKPNLSRWVQEARIRMERIKGTLGNDTVDNSAEGGAGLNPSTSLRAGNPRTYLTYSKTNKKENTD